MGIEHAAVESQRELLIVELGGVVVSDAERVLDDALDFLQRTGGVLCDLFNLCREVVNEGEDVFERAINDRQLLFVESLILKRGINEVDAHSDALDDVEERDVGEIKRCSEIRQDDSQLARFSLPVRNRFIEVERQ